MDYYETSSHDSEAKEGHIDGQGRKYKIEISKFHATIATVSRNMRKDDWIYLQRHPEIRAIIRVVTSEVIKANASNIYQFIADMFRAENAKDLIEKINIQIKAVNEQMRGGTWTTADGEMTFPESTQKSSESNASCPATKLNASNHKEDEYVKPVCPEHFRPSCK